MTIEAPLLHLRHVWSSDVVLFAVAELDPDVRTSLGLSDGEFALNLIGKSQGSQILNREAAALLQLFADPSRTIDAIERLARSEGQPVKTILPGALSLIGQWRQNGVLVDSDARDSERLSNAASPLSFDGYRMLRLLRSGADAETYLVEDARHERSVLKIANPGREASLAPQLDREAQLLAHLNGLCTPAFLERGSFAGRPFLRMEWLAGTGVDAVASKLRMSARDARAEVLELIRSMVRAYALIHTAGVIHGDVHPGNVLVLPSSEVRIVDFGLLRGGFPFFFEPEHARALLEKLPARPPTASGEVYALGALIYLLVTGEHYLDFSPDRELALGQILTDEMRPFSSCDLVPWPELETILARALAKEPSARYSSVEQLEAALQRISLTAGVRGSVPARGETLIDELLDPYLALEPPAASVGYGAAGIAYVLRRAACIMDRPDLLAAAELWVDRAWKEAAKPTGFVSEKYKIGEAVAAPTSLYYGLAGVHVVAASVGQTAGELRPLGRAIDYLTSLDETIAFDAVSGSASALLGCAALLELHPRGDAWEIKTLLATGSRLCEHLSRCGNLAFLGAAHGRAGVLQAVMRWHGSVGTPPPAAVGERLSELASLAIVDGNRASWPIGRGDRRGLGGWCHGAAGYVSLWATAYRTFGDDAFLTLALKAAEYVNEFPERSIGQLCCGLVGQVESLLIVYRLTGDRRWIERARRLASFIDRSSLLPHSLMRGRVSVALLDLDLLAPDSAGIPFFDRELL